MSGFVAVLWSSIQMLERCLTQLPKSRSVYTKDTNSYLYQIRRIPLLRADEEIELARQVVKLAQLERVREHLCQQLGRLPHDREWADAVDMSLSDFRYCLHRGHRAKDKMVQSHLRFVVTIARRYRERGLDFQDLIQEGNLGLMRAVEQYDPNSGCRFLSYAIWSIRQAIIRAIAQKSRPIRLPLHFQTEMSRVWKTTKQMAREMGRKPTQEEIATRMKMPVTKIQLIFRCTQPIIFLETPRLIYDPEGWIVNEETMGESIEFEGETPEEYASKQWLGEALAKILALLNFRRGEVLRMRYGLNEEGEKTTREIAERFGMSKTLTLQVEDKAIYKLRQILRTNNIFSEDIYKMEIKRATASGKNKKW